MADDPRTNPPSAGEANRNNAQGGGVGQRDLDAQQDAGRADGEERSFGDLGVGTPPGVDIHKLGQSDKPEQDWGEAGDPEATFSRNHVNRGAPNEADRAQGAKTRAATKDMISRRG
jgi:hypothetical protein